MVLRRRAHGTSAVGVLLLALTAGGTGVQAFSSSTTSAAAGTVAIGRAARSEDAHRTAQLAERLAHSGCVCGTDSAGSSDFVLAFDARGHLGLSAPARGLAPLTVDFQEGRMGFRASAQAAAMAAELVVKAVRPSGKPAPLVWDLTAGLGRDR
jgi:Putative SAM-dependent methyltransferase